MLRRAVLAALLLFPAALAAEEEPNAAAPDAPFTLDNSACPAFLTGIWLANSQQDLGGALWHVTEALVFNPDGRIEQAFAAGTAGDDPEETKTFGTWTAGPGATSDRCAVTLIFEEGETRSVDVAALTGTRVLIEGQAFTRAR